MTINLSNTDKNRLKGVRKELITVIDAAMGASPHNFFIAHNGGYRTAAQQQRLYSVGRGDKKKVFYGAASGKPYYGKECPGWYNLLYKGCKNANTITQIDGITKKSKHQTGDAFDIVAKDRWGRVVWDKKYYKAIADVIIGEGMKRGVLINWGGDWKNFKDYPHFEFGGFTEKTNELPEIEIRNKKSKINYLLWGVGAVGVVTLGYILIKK